MSDLPLARSDSPRPLPDGLLEVQAGGLRRVAHAVLGDVHAAEDAVQDAWIAALERPPRVREGTGVGAWLRQVTRRRALRWRRGEGRRAAREQAVARHEAVGSVDEEVARREVLREVVEAVLGLPEPYQTAVLQRYFEDLSPRDIARHTGTTVATVDSRLHRARVLLRERLDAASGGDRAAWVPALAVWTGWSGGAAGVPAAEPPTSAADAARGPRTAARPDAAAAGGTTMQTKLLLAGGLLATIGGGTWFAVRAAGSDVEADGDGAATITAGSRAAEPGADRARLVGDTVADAAPARESVGDTPVVPALARSLTFTGTLFTDEDQPFGGARLWLAQPGHPWNLAGESDPLGRFELELELGSGAPLLYAYVDHPAVNALGFRVFTLDEAATPVRWGVYGGGNAEAQYFEAKARVAQAVNESADEKERLQALTDAELLYQELLRQREGRFRPKGEALAQVDDGRLRRFRWSALAPLEDPQVQDLAEQEALARLVAQKNADTAQSLRALGYAGDPALPPQEFEEPVEELLDFTDEVLNHDETVEDEPARLRVHGTVSAADGSLAHRAAVRVVLGDRPYRVYTDERGEYQLELPAPQSLVLHAGGGEYGQATESLSAPHVAPGAVGELEWSPRLDRGRELTGRVRGAGLEPGTLVVEFEDRSGNWVDFAGVGDDGAFALPNLPERAGRLLVRRAGSPLALSVVDNVSVSESHLEVEVSTETLAAGRIEIDRPERDGQSLEDFEVRVVQPGTGVGSWVPRTSSTAHGLAVPPTHLRLEAGAVSAGFVDLGDLWVEPGATHPLAAPALPQPTAPTLSGADATEFVLLRDDLGFTTELSRGAPDALRALVLPPGSYRLQ